MEKSQTDARKTHGKSIYDKTWGGKYWGFNGVLMLASWRLLWYIMTCRAGQGFVAAASSYVSAAGDIKRNGDLSKRTDKIKFYFAGGFALLFARACLATRFNQLSRCSANELDVIGNICSKARNFDLAEKIEEEVTTRSQKIYYVEDHTLAFVCGWAMDHPRCCTHCKEAYRSRIRILLEKNPAWKPEIKARIYALLSEKKLEKIERKKIAGQFK